MKQIIFNKSANEITFDDLLQNDLIPMCHACIYSYNMPFHCITCDFSDKETDWFSKQNLYSKKCEHFKTDITLLESLAREQNKTIIIKTQNRFYTFG